MSKKGLFTRDNHSVRRRVFTFKVVMRTLEAMLVVAELIDQIRDIFKK